MATIPRPSTSPTLFENVMMWINIFYLIFLSFVKSLLPQGALRRKSVRGKTVLITGSGSGIGRLMALEFSKLGATVVLWDINQEGNEETKNKIENFGGQAHSYRVDLSQKEEIYKAAKLVKEEVGDISILVNNAGVISGHFLLECSDEQIERTMAVNTTAHLWTTRCFLPYMLEQNDGHIVTIASIAGKIGAPQMVDYCASKFGAVGFHEALTVELEAIGAKGVYTTVVCPYFIDTGMFAGFKILNTSLLPSLTPDYVASCIMEAVLTNTQEVIIPKAGYILAAAPHIFPAKVVSTIAKSLGMEECMRGFKGRTVKETNGSIH